MQASFYRERTFRHSKAIKSNSTTTRHKERDRAAAFRVAFQPSITHLWPRSGLLRRLPALRRSTVAGRVLPSPIPSRGIPAVGQFTTCGEEISASFLRLEEAFRLPSTACVSQRKSRTIARCSRCRILHAKPLCSRSVGLRISQTEEQKRKHFVKAWRIVTRKSCKTCGIGVRRTAGRVAASTFSRNVRRLGFAVSGAFRQGRVSLCRKETVFGRLRI